jgi:hypothetical protein
MVRSFCALRVMAILLLSLGACYSVRAQGTNGCGTGWNRYLVPDRIKIVGCDFKKACDNHDICYGQCSRFSVGGSPAQCEYLRCERGADLFGKQECDSVAFRENRIAAQERRSICDAAFMVDITRTNPGNQRCDLFSGFYPFVVRVLGVKHFLGMDAVDHVAMSETDRAQYAEALNMLFNTWPEDKLFDLATQVRQGRAKVDLTRPIEFDAQLGLRNRAARAR